jgi:hypothetical protein
VGNFVVAKHTVKRKFLVDASPRIKKIAEFSYWVEYTIKFNRTLKSYPHNNLYDYRIKRVYVEGPVSGILGDMAKIFPSDHPLMSEPFNVEEPVKGTYGSFEAVIEDETSLSKFFSCVQQRFQHKIFDGTGVRKDLDSNSGKCPPNINREFTQAVERLVEKANQKITETLENAHERVSNADVRRAVEIGVSDYTMVKIFKSLFGKRYELNVSENFRGAPELNGDMLGTSHFEVEYRDKRDKRLVMPNESFTRLATLGINPFPFMVLVTGTGNRMVDTIISTKTQTDVIALAGASFMYCR